MKSFILNFFFIFSFILSYSQDSITIFMDNNFQQVKESKATITRTAVIKGNRYCLTDKFIQDKMINYGEFISLDPFIEDGESINYNSDGSEYSTGHYKNGKLIGNWIYYSKMKNDTVNYQDSYNHYLKQQDTCNILDQKISSIDSIKENLKRDIIDFVYPKLNLPARCREIKPYYLINAQVIIDTNGNIECIEVKDDNIDLKYESYRI
jgi:hypothetical protein